MSLPIGTKHIQLAKLWLPSAMRFGTAAAAAGLYFTDWKLVLQYMPFYNGKFKTEE